MNGRPIRLYSSHLETRDVGPGRARQAAEIRADAGKPGRPAAQIVAGDFNTWTVSPLVANVPLTPEPAVRDFFNAGWQDGLPGQNAVTHLGAGFFPQRLDWLHHRGIVAGPGGVAGDVKGSDHFPLFMELAPF